MNISLAGFGTRAGRGAPAVPVPDGADRHGVRRDDYAAPADTASQDLEQASCCGRPRKAPTPARPANEGR